MTILCGSSLKNIGVYIIQSLIKETWMLPSPRSPGMLAEQFAADGPKLQLYDFAEKHWEQLMNWQHATMYLFFGLAGTVSLIIHTTDAAPLALDRLMLAIAFFNEGNLDFIHFAFRCPYFLHILYMYYFKLLNHLSITCCMLTTR